MLVCCIMSGMHSAVFLIDIANLEAVFLSLPFLYEFSGFVSRAIVNYQPNEILTFLRFK